MIWYCYKKGSHIVCRSKEGLLIRGIPEHLIFEVNASNRTEASEKAAEILKIWQHEASAVDAWPRNSC
jgi:hypothetical protein